MGSNSFSTELKTVKNHMKKITSENQSEKNTRGYM